jgi:gliding motility-associated-like protein
VCWSQKHNLLPDTIGICAGDSVSIEIKHQFDRNASIKWLTPAGSINGTKKIRALRQGMYYIRISSDEFPQALTDSTYVRLYARPLPALQDTFLCRGQSLVLDAGNHGMHYLWHNSLTSRKITVEGAGRYWVKIRNGRCAVVDTVYVRLRPSASVPANEVSFCLGEENKTLTVKAPQMSKILWNTGASTPGIYVSREGTYWVRTETEACGVQVDTVRVKLKACDCEMIIPNSFTPNEDNRNDYFFPVLQCEYSYYTISITDRWGNTVFSSNSYSAKWDGRYKGNLCPEDNYIYRIESTEKGTDKKLVRNGHISLFR